MSIFAEFFFKFYLFARFYLIHSIYTASEDSIFVFHRERYINKLFVFVFEFLLKILNFENYWVPHYRCSNPGVSRQQATYYHQTTHLKWFNTCFWTFSQRRWNAVLSTNLFQECPLAFCEKQITSPYFLTHLFHLFLLKVFKALTIKLFQNVVLEYGFWS